MGSSRNTPWAALGAVTLLRLDGGDQVANNRGYRWCSAQIAGCGSLAFPSKIKKLFKIKYLNFYALMGARLVSSAPERRTATFKTGFTHIRKTVADAGMNPQ